MPLLCAPLPQALERVQEQEQAEAALLLAEELSGLGGWSADTVSQDDALTPHRRHVARSELSSAASDTSDGSFSWHSLSDESVRGEEAAAEAVAGPGLSPPVKLPPAPWMLEEAGASDCGARHAHGAATGTSLS